MKRKFSTPLAVMLVTMFMFSSVVSHAASVDNNKAEEAEATDYNEAYKSYIEDNMDSTITVKAYTFTMTDYLDFIEPASGSVKMTTLEKRFFGKGMLEKVKLSMSAFNYYQIIDLDKDGTPELLLSDEKKSNGVYSLLILDYENGVVSPEILFTGIRGGVGKSKDNRLAFWYGGSDFSMVLILQYKNHSLQPFAILRWESGKYKKSGKPTLTYAKKPKFKSKKISSKKYNKERKKYKTFKIKNSIS